MGEHNGHDNDSLEALEHKHHAHGAVHDPPGSIGGVLTDLAVAGNSVYVATLDLPLTYTTLELPVATSSNGRLAGEVEALNLATGKVRMGQKGEASAGRRRHGLQRSCVHDAVRRHVACDRPRAPGAIVYTPQAAHDRPTRRSRSPGVR